MRSRSPSSSSSASCSPRERFSMHRRVQQGDEEEEEEEQQKMMMHGGDPLGSTLPSTPFRSSSGLPAMRQLPVVGWPGVGPWGVPSSGDFSAFDMQSGGAGSLPMMPDVDGRSLQTEDEMEEAVQRNIDRLVELMQKQHGGNSGMDPAQLRMSLESFLDSSARGATGEAEEDEAPEEYKQQYQEPQEQIPSHHRHHRHRLQEEQEQQGQYMWHPEEMQQQSRAPGGHTFSGGGFTWPLFQQNLPGWSPQPPPQEQESQQQQEFAQRYAQQQQEQQQRQQQQQLLLPDHRMLSGSDTATTTTTSTTTPSSAGHQRMRWNDYSGARWAGKSTTTPHSSSTGGSGDTAASVPSNKQQQEETGSSRMLFTPPSEGTLSGSSGSSRLGGKRDASEMEEGEDENENEAEAEAAEDFEEAAGGRHPRRKKSKRVADSEARIGELRRKQDSHPGGLTEAEASELKSKERRLRNRESALRCRQRKYAHVGQLEEKLQQEQNQVRQLQEQLQQREDQLFLLYSYMCQWQMGTAGPQQQQQQVPPPPPTSREGEKPPPPHPPSSFPPQ